MQRLDEECMTLTPMVGTKWSDGGGFIADSAKCDSTALVFCRIDAQEKSEALPATLPALAATTTTVTTPTPPTVQYTYVTLTSCGGTKIKDMIRSLSAAKAECDSDVKCKCIDDLNCDGSFWYTYDGPPKSGGSDCAWHKRMFVNLVKTNHRNK